jgi:predicted nuclease of predicted toxin-antitoxin system
MDVHVQSAITSGLRRRGVDVLTAQEDGSDELDDPDLLDRAELLGRVLFTRDDDFKVIAASLQEGGIPFVGVIFVHVQRLSIGECIRELENIAKCSDPEDWQDKLTYLPL